MDIDRDELRRARLGEPLQTPSKVENGSNSASSDSSGGSTPSGTGRGPLVLSVLGLILGIVLAVFVYLGWNQQAELIRQVSILNQQTASLADSINLIADQLEDDQDQLNSINSDVALLQNKLGVTTNELNRARAYAEKLREEQERNVEVLTDQIREKADTEHLADLGQRTDTKFEEIDQEISVVKEDVTSSREEIEKTWKELSSLGLQVTEQGNLIATNADGVAELVRRGERDYFRFDALRKKRMKVGDITFELRKADTKRQRVDFKLFYDDREVEQKRVYTNTPVTFYVGRDRIVHELVINEVRKNEASGYISVPKGSIATAPVMGNSSD
ncbi:MAG: hypothetical protein JSU96_20140 [Acidobacteriota bacterium]|nr:MAG: hypothetical protein JSU96_20140 [Acidobacteriota bacterium]